MRPAYELSLSKVLDTLTLLGVNFRLEGGQRQIHRVCSIFLKEPNGLYYYNGPNDDIFTELTDCVVICRAEALGNLHGNSAIIVDDDPQRVMYRLCNAMFGAQQGHGIHPTAIIHPMAQIGPNVSIGPYCTVGQSTLGAGSRLVSHVVVGDGCTIGAGVTIEPHACIGAMGVAWVWGENGHREIMPLLGGVTIGDNCFLGADVGVVRGMYNEDTTIEEGTMIAPGSKIGHGCKIKRFSHLANNVTLAGWAEVGERSFLGSGCVLRPHAKVAAGTIVGSGSVVIKDISEPNTTVAGIPAQQIPSKQKSSGVPTRYSAPQQNSD